MNKCTALVLEGLRIASDKEKSEQQLSIIRGPSLNITTAEEADARPAHPGIVFQLLPNNPLYLHRGMRLAQNLDIFHQIRADLRVYCYWKVIQNHWTEGNW